MSTVAAYKRVLERLYTLIGKEFGIVVVAVNPDWTNSNAAARELLLVSRSVSTEARIEASTKQVIQGPVVRYDLLSDATVKRGVVSDVVELKTSDIRAAFAGRSLPPGTPLLIVLVGVSSSVLAQLNECKEPDDFRDIASAGYAVLSYKAVEDGPPMRLSYVLLCDKSKNTAGAKFLLGSEVIDATRTLSYAIRIQEAPSPPLAAAEPLALRLRQHPSHEPMRGARWKKQEAIQPVRSQVAPVDWEKLVHSTVEIQIKKLLGGKAEHAVIDLGGGLVCRIWPEMVQRISEAHEWTVVFTHQSVNPTPRANYESFETLGDKVLSLSLVHHLFSDTSRTLDSNGLTDSHKEILSSVKQAAMASTMGLRTPGLVRTTVSVDDKMLEDLYEAFFGCLFTVGNRLVEGGNQGLPLCEALFKEILHETFPDLDPWSVPKDPQTTLDQIFIRLAWGHPVLNYNEDTRVTTIRLTRDAHGYLESVGPPIKMDKPLAIGPRAADKPSSARAAAEIALSALKLGWGIDSRYTNIVVRSRLMKDDRYAAVQREALKVAERMGYIDVYVARRAKNHNQLYAVIGVRPNDSEVQLHVYKYESPETRGQEDMQSISTRVAAYITALRGFMAAHGARTENLTGTAELPKKTTL